MKSMMVGLYAIDFIYTIGTPELKMKYLVFKGPPGYRHRMIMAGELGGPLTKMSLERSDDDWARALPLPVSAPDWCPIAKI